MTPVAEFHETVKAAVDKVRKEAGAFVSFVTVSWDEGKLTEISTQMGTSSKYPDKEAKDDG